MAVTPKRFWSVTPFSPSGASGNQKKATPSTPLPMSRKKCWPRPPGSSSVFTSFMPSFSSYHATVSAMSRATSARWLKPRSSNSVLVFFPLEAMARHSSVGSPHCTPSVAGGQASARNGLRSCAQRRCFVYKRPMPRLKQIPKADAEAPIVKSMYKRLFGDRDPVAEPGTATGTPGDWWTVFANSPEVLEHACRGFALYASPERKLPAHLRELGQTRAGWLVGSQFVFSQHCKACRAYGFSEEKIEALKAWSTSDLFTPPERALLAYTDSLVQSFGRADYALFDELREHFSDEEILEFTYITMMYAMHAVISVALRLEYDDRSDPIVEIAAPEDYTPS